MQNSNLSGAFDTLLKKNLWAEKLSHKLQTLKKKLESKIKTREPEKLNPKSSKKSQLLNLRLVAELQKKLDAIKQKINKND
ncbi:MAG: hypothetical protein K9L85_02290 [Candidatus Peribacteraceae bacterium]|nr:hypothetical protein [Candidatus Peribacteraceae bacterium]